jgi:hypothetical protein
MHSVFSFPFMHVSSFDLHYLVMCFDSFYLFTQGGNECLHQEIHLAIGKAVMSYETSF